MTRLAAGLGAAAACLLGLLPGTAAAHALLEATSPARGAALERAPAAVTLRFSEPVEGAFGAVRVFDAEGRRVTVDAPSHPRSRPAELRAELPAGLPAGGYTVTYRVISADSHPVAGGFVFSIGEASAAPAPVEELLAGTGSGPVTTTALAAARSVSYGAVALGIGTLAFLLLAWLPGLRLVAGGGAAWRTASERFGRRARALIAIAAVAGGLAALVALVLQGAAAGGTSAWAALDAGVLREVLGTRFGTAQGIAALAWAAVLVVATVGPSPAPALRPASLGATGFALGAGPPRAAVAALAVPLLVLAAVPALGGHPAAGELPALAVPANVAHVLAASAWLGGVAVLVLALRTATVALAPADRTRLLAAAVGRFSAVAGAAIALVVLSGAVQALLYVRTPAHLLDTAYGRAVAIKLLLLGAIVALGALHRRRHLPGLRRSIAAGAAPGAAGAGLRRGLGAELAVGIAALAVTGALAGSAPATTVALGPFSTEASLGPANLELTVEPARPGLNQLHLYLFAKRDGRPFEGSRELEIAAALPSKAIGPIALQPRRAGPGHYVVAGASLGVAGDWTLRISSRVSEFDEHMVRVELARLRLRRPPA